MLQQNHLPHNQLNHTHLSPPTKHHHHSLFFNPKPSTYNQQFSNEFFNPQNLSHDHQNPKNPTEEEGFAFDHDDGLQITIIEKQDPNIHMNDSVSMSKKFVPYRIKQPKIKLTFISKQKQPEPLSLTLKKQYDNKSMQMKKATLHSQSMILNSQKLLLNCVIKVKRNFVADSIAYQNYSTDENKRIKFQIISTGNKIVYELIRENSTYAHLTLLREKFLKASTETGNGIRKNSITSNKAVNNKTVNEKIINQQKPQKTPAILRQTVPYLPKNPSPPLQNNSEQFFLDSPLNQLLKSKLKQSFIHHKRREPNKNHTEEIEFESQFQSGNLQFAAKVNHSIQIASSFSLGKQQLSQTKQSQATSIPEYNLSLRNDTNTHGHQNWFYFRLKNMSKTSKRVKLNIVNLKRNLHLIKQGQKVYARNIHPVKSQWVIAGENIDIKENKTTTVYRSRVRTLSFEIQLNAETQYEVSLLPPYTYSEMLSDIEELKQSKYAKVQTLTYSLVGMAIPIITFTNPQVQDTKKQVILISSRIHPGQTVASFIVKGIIESLSNPKDSAQVEEFLNSTIIKIIPIINPDGVVFGNFRTNYLGYDLNRSFHSQDEITNPEIVALKQLGRKLKNTHGDKFHTFIDLHGHSSQKNIFTYGPDFQNGNQNFYKARLLPKLLNSKSPYFKYGSCTFKLEEYKSSTARAFFINLGVTSFTIESSYAIYESENGKNELLTQKQWLSFGQTLSDSISLISRLNKTHSIKNRTTLKRVISLTEDDNYHLLNALKKQMKKQQTIKKTRKIIADKGDQDSDGQDQNQDLNANERQDIEKKLMENTAKNFLLPKVFKPSILYPTVTPKIFNIGQTSVSSYKILYTRRNRYQSIKTPQSTYLYSLQGMESFKPKARNIKIEQKMG